MISDEANDNNQITVNLLSQDKLPQSTDQKQDDIQLQPDQQDQTNQYVQQLDIESDKNNNNAHENTQEKESRQFKALLYKNTALQIKQPCTNICQILTPLICLAFVYVIKKLAGSQLLPDFTLPVAFMNNVPRLYNTFPEVYTDDNDCEWYYFNTNSADYATQSFVGYHYGDGKKNGMLSNLIGPNYSICWLEDRKSQDYDDYYIPFQKDFEYGTTINSEIYSTLQYLSTQPFEMGEQVQGLDYLPDGAVDFKQVSNTVLEYTASINDQQESEFHRNNGVTQFSFSSKKSNHEYMRVAEGMVSLVDLINRSYIKYVTSKLEKKTGGIWLISGIEYMPIVGQVSGYILRIISLLGSCMYPLALSLLFPIFMYLIVLDKETKMMEMMKMNGMRMLHYWVITVVFCFIITLLTNFIFLMGGVFFLDLDFFTQTNSGLLIIVLLGWGLAQISQAIFFSVFLSKARSATIIGYLLSVVQTMVALTYNVNIYPVPKTLPVYMLIYTPFTFSRAIYLMSMGCSNGQCYKKFSTIPNELALCIVILYVGALVFFFLGIYLHEVVAQEYGTSQEVLFFLKSCKKRRRTMHQQTQSKSAKLDTDKLQEDEDTKQERLSIYAIQEENDLDEYPLICKDLRKVYPSVEGRKELVAVKNLTFGIKKGEIFGLLGPNGAGKTTLISMITGIYPPSTGNAWIGGHDILNDIGQVHLNIGVCPQFDLLWPDLTVEDHLLFYARLKGVPRSQEKIKVDQAIAEVYLTEFKHFKTRELSGGMKRRLSVAISLVGQPLIIFLDEPSTGLDPENRRQLWDILGELKGKRSILLTTHSMEEADVLCSRVGIITNGVLRCIGNQIRLKSLYGGGYHLYINCMKKRVVEQLANPQISNQEKQINKIMENKHQILKENIEKVIKYIKELLPNANLVSNFNGNIIFQVQIQGLQVSKLFYSIDEKKQELGIEDWGISQSTLEDVFMNIVNTEKANNEDDEI